MFYAIRIVLFLVGVFVLVVVLVRKHKAKKAAVVGSVCLYFALISVITVFPVENLFYTFDSPYDAFDYIGDGQVVDVLYGKESAFVVYSRDGKSFDKCIMNKSGDGYKLPEYYAAKQVFHSFGRAGNFIVYRARRTDDYYLRATITTTDDTTPNVENYGEQVYIRRIDFGFFAMYSRIENYGSEYAIFVNGERIALAESK